MAIDKRIDAAESMIASDERQEPPSMARQLAEVAALLPPVRAVLGPVSELVTKWLDRHRNQNRDYMVKVLKDEIRQPRIDVDKLTDEQRRFYEQTYPSLLLDGLRKAENLRARERIARIGKILGYAAEQGVARSPDYTEEMMRIAMDLDPIDVDVLLQIYQAQNRILLHSDEVPMDEVNDAWRDMCPKIAGFRKGDLESVCAKLQSYGLVTRVERNTSKLPPNENPYALLPKGRSFVDYIKGVTREQAAAPGA